MDTSVSTIEICVRLTMAALFGGLLGFEREWKRKPAGLRTHIMVALGSTCFSLIGFELYTSLRGAGDGVTSLDPMRLVEGIAGGIGFLGAGAILTRGSSVEGLTTAGGIWLTGAIGLACGGGHLTIAALATGFGLFTLCLLGLVERALADR